MSPRRRTVLAAGLAALLAGGAAGHASGQEPGAAARPAPPGPAGTAVKDVMKEALKDAAKGALQGAAAAVPAAAPTPAAAPAAGDPVARAAMLRRKTLREEDFVDNEETNRDPFRSFMRLFVDKGVAPQTRKVPAIFEKFALEELTLIAVVSGDAQPRAMFRDPGGLGQTIKRGDYVSKAGARVTKILSDRVVLELNETTANGETRPFEKAILVNPEDAQK